VVKPLKNGGLNVPKSMTLGYLVYYIVDGEPHFLGLFQTREAADADAAIVSKADKRDWKVAAVPFVGWGYVAPGVFSQNGPPPINLVDD
jgi:hypothetical protein